MTQEMEEMCLTILVDNQRFFFYFNKEIIPVKMKKAWRKSDMYDTNNHRVIKNE